MKTSFLRLKPLAVAAKLMGIGFASLLIVQPSLAEPSELPSLPNYDPQTNTDDPYNTENNPFSNSYTSNGFGVFNLIHRANFAVPSFDQNAQNQQINDAVEAFKSKSQQQMQQGQQQPTSGFQINTPGVVTTPSR
ncbi:MAG: hypothetical protein N2235_24330 [Fischerella sp.]|nr:hypothetical protein [Fischerella sp.]